VRQWASIRSIPNVKTIAKVTSIAGGLTLVVGVVVLALIVRVVAYILATVLSLLI